MEQPRVSVALVVRRDTKVLLGKRKRPPFAWGFPGGKLGFGEDIKDCIIRELEEEVGIHVKNLDFATVTNDIHREINQHFVTLIMTADHKLGEVTLKEPEKCEEWAWFSWDDLPEPLSLPVTNLKKQGFSTF